jgi:hypothetical protein
MRELKGSNASAFSINRIEYRTQKRLRLAGDAFAD